MQASLADVHGVIVARGGDSQVILLESTEMLGVRWKTSEPYLEMSLTSCYSNSQNLLTGLFYNNTCKFIIININ